MIFKEIGLSKGANEKDLLLIERTAILKAHQEFGEEFVRPLEEAEVILDLFRYIYINLYLIVQNYPSIQNLFDTEFTNWNNFFARESVFDIIYIDDFLIPEKEMFSLIQENNAPRLDNQKIQLIKDYFSKWGTNKKDNHEKTQAILKNSFNLETKSSDLACACVQCLADHRTRIREAIFDDLLTIIEKAKTDIISAQERNDDASEIYGIMQRDLEQNLFKSRSRLKKSSLNRLESQIKHKIKEYFDYPSAMCLKHTEKIKPFITQMLRQEGLRPDFLNDDELGKFYYLMGTNVWRSERFLEKEFKKFIKSAMVLKRKDISASILKEYLGEFWVHSRARRLNRKIIYHMGPTNSGKTYHAINALCQAKKGCYLAPLRLLAAELYDTMNSRGVKTTLLTGEEVVEVEGATHFSSTIEMARFQEDFDSAVIDEIQMITDPQRGWAWTRGLVNICAREVHLCGDQSVLSLVEEIVKLCGDTLEIKRYERMTELKIETKPLVVGDLQRSDALIVFSRRNALKYKYDLEQLGFKVSIVYGRLSPEVRREQARKFDVGETDVIVSTDAIAMGMNLPIQRIIFSTLTKNIDDEEIAISISEIKQISGRAGRFNRFPIGHVSCLTKVKGGIDQIREALNMPLGQQSRGMVGPDLDIFNQVNNALKINSLPALQLSEFLRLFNTMIFKHPFYCVDLKEMIELTEIVEEADHKHNLSSAEVFGFACAPVNIGLIEHVEYYVWILNQFVNSIPIKCDTIDSIASDIDYLETSIKCVELYQWLSRHFNNKNFIFDEFELLHNKQKAVDRLNELLSDKIVPTCSSCGCQLPKDAKFSICENCFRSRRFQRRGNSGRQQGRYNGSDSSRKDNDVYRPAKNNDVYRPKVNRPAVNDSPSIASEKLVSDLGEIRAPKDYKPVKKIKFWSKTNNPFKKNKTEFDKDSKNKPEKKKLFSFSKRKPR